MPLPSLFGHSLMTFAVALVLLVTLAMAGQAHAETGPNFRLTGSFTLASGSLSKGITETDGNGQAAANLNLRKGHFRTGLRLINVRSSDGADHQWQISQDYSGKAAGLGLVARLAYKSNEGVRAGSDKDNFELTTEVTKPILGKYTRAKWQMIYSPDNSGDGKQAWWNELSISHDRNDRLTLTVGVAHRTTTPPRNYSALIASAALKIAPRLTVDIRYHDTDKHGYGKRYQGALLIGLTRRFG
jgi:hypothetical protein